MSYAYSSDTGTMHSITDKLYVAFTDSLTDVVSSVGSQEKILSEGYFATKYGEGKLPQLDGALVLNLEAKVRTWGHPTSKPEVDET